jgi:hypothetical protein
MFSHGGGVAMRRFIAAAVTLIVNTSPVFTAPAPMKLAPADIQKSFFNGEPFTASTPAGIAYKMVFMANGKVTREPTGKAGVKGDGTWKLDKTGFCTTWKGSQPNCFVVVSTGDNKWSVMKGTAVIAVWSK